jgi:hypothetical protein
MYATRFDALFERGREAVLAGALPRPVKIPRPAVPEPFVWVIAWIVATVMFWLGGQAIGSPKSWYTSALLAGIVIVAGEFVDRYKQKR